MLVVDTNIKAAIIGNGPVGTLYLETLYQLAQEFPEARFQIDWYGRDQPFGAGIYNPEWFGGEADALILNVRPGDMGKRFVDYCEARGYSAEDFVPRGLYGDFCVQDARQLINHPPANVVINPINAEVNKYGRNSDGRHILGFNDNGFAGGYHLTCMALGHDWASHRPAHLKDNPAFIEHPYAPHEFGQWLDHECGNINGKKLVALLGQGAGTMDALRWLEKYHAPKNENLHYAVISKGAERDFWWAYDWHQSKHNLPVWLTDGTVQVALCQDDGDKAVIKMFKNAEKAGAPVSHMLVALNAYLDVLATGEHAETTELLPTYEKLKNWGQRRYGALTAPENVALVQKLSAEKRLHFDNVNERINPDLITILPNGMLRLEAAGCDLIAHGVMVTATNSRSMADEFGRIRDPLLESLQVPLTPSGLIKLDKRTGEVEGRPGVYASGPKTNGTWGIETFGRQIAWSAESMRRTIRNAPPRQMADQRAIFQQKLA